MPTRRIGGFLCYFVSYNCTDPPHIHRAKSRDRATPNAKFWLNPVTLVRNRGLTPGDLQDAHRIVERNRDLFLEIWDEYCND